MDDEKAREIVERFKATHQVRHWREPRPRRRQCVVCGDVFLATRDDARYCSNAHRQKAHRERHRGEPKQIRLGLFRGGQGKTPRMVRSPLPLDD
jgi:hypothetical protein